MKKHCLLITPLELWNLKRRHQGAYLRLGVFVKAISEAGLDLRVVCTREAHDGQKSLEVIADEVAAQIAEVWNIDAAVVVNVAKPKPTSPWLFQQIQEIFSYRYAPAARAWFSHNCAAILRDELAREPACVFAHRLAPMHALSQLASITSPVFFDLDDVEHIMRWRTLPVQASVRNRILGHLALPSLLLAEYRSIRRASRTFVCSEIDAQRCRSLFREKTIEAVNNTVAIPPTPAAIIAGKILLFVGVYSYGPNADAAEYFIASIFPLIQRRVKNAEVWFVGNGADELASYPHPPPGVKFLGFVDDLEEIYRQARAVICPIRYGSGTRVKLVEAAAWGKPMVSTTVGAEGLEMIHGTHLLLADTADDFANSCVRLMNDDALCAALADSARQFAVANFDKNNVSKKLAFKIKQTLL